MQTPALLNDGPSRVKRIARVLDGEPAFTEAELDAMDAEFLNGGSLPSQVAQAWLVADIFAEQDPEVKAWLNR